jgi:hypothetical protein
MRGLYQQFIIEQKRRSRTITSFGFFFLLRPVYFAVPADFVALAARPPGFSSAA